MVLVMVTFPITRAGCTHTVNRTTTHGTCAPVCRPGALIAIYETRTCRASARHARRGKALAQASPSQLVLEEDRKHSIKRFALETSVTWPGYHDYKLVIRPLEPHLHEATADLLTESFVETHHFKSYRAYLKQRIVSYVRSQVKLLPCTIILTAVLQPPSPLQQHPQGDGHGHTAESGLQSSMHAQHITQADTLLQSDANGNSDSQWRGAHSSRSHSEAMGQGTATPAELQLPQDSAENAILIGTAEVSFDRSTHAMYLTLNPPTKCAYLCNMAVSEQWRRRGVALQLVRAVEQIVLDMGETDVYLHLRVKDAPAAALYQSAGFIEAAADWPLVKLLGQEPRRLMRKQLVSNGGTQT